MATLIDFEELIDLDEIQVQKENEDSLFGSQEPLSEVLDEICKNLDVNELEKSFEHIQEQRNIPDYQEFSDLESANADNVLQSDICTTVKSNSVIIFQDEQNCNSVKVNSCTDFDIVQNVEKIDNVEANDRTEENITSPTSKGLAEFNQIYKETFLTNNNLQRSDDNKTEERVDLYDNDEIINLDELGFQIDEPATHDITFDERKDNGQATKLLLPENDFDDPTNAEKLHVNTNNIDESFDSNNNNVHEYAITTAINIEVVKEDLRDIECSHVLKTVEIGIANDDIISISSESDDGYNSSDFEFITEEEAKKAGITSKDSKKVDAATPGTSKQKCNAANKYDSLPDHIKYHRNRYIHSTLKANRDSHVVPDNENLANLFRQLPILNGVYYSTNKNLLHATGTFSTTDGFGFSLQHNIEERSEFQKEADETAKKIRFLYSGVNRKRRRF